MPYSEASILLDELSLEERYEEHIAYEQDAKEDTKNDT